MTNILYTICIYVLVSLLYFLFVWKLKDHSGNMDADENYVFLNAVTNQNRFSVNER